MSYLKTGTRHTHRIVAEQKLGRPLLKGEIVHHIDGNNKNNLPENLEILPNQSAHAKLHFSGVKKTPKKVCKNGHLLFGDNVELTSIGRRRCVICRKEYDKKWKQNKRRERGLKKPGAKPGIIKKRNQRGQFA